MLPTTNAIIPANQVDLVQKLHMLVRALKDQVFVDGLDYGIIPGTGDKPTLLQPGMEKLCRALNAVPKYIERFVLRDYDRNIFHFEYECQLVDAETGMFIPGGTGIGLATSRETKWRWREAKRVCPVCGKAAIIKGKPEYGGGWLCFKKQEGCGAKFDIDDKAITDQKTGRVENEDIADQINTICKIAQKRALGSAIKGAANVSEFFTVDLEDLPPTEPPVITIEKPEASGPKSNGGKPQSSGNQPPEPQPSSATEKTAESTDEDRERAIAVTQSVLNDWRSKGLKDDQIAAALKVGKWSEWDWSKGRESADKAILAWIDEDAKKTPPAAPKAESDAKRLSDDEWLAREQTPVPPDDDDRDISTADVAKLFYAAMKRNYHLDQPAVRELLGVRGLDEWKSGWNAAEDIIRTRTAEPTPAK